MDRGGHTATADGPLLICYDGSDHAARAGRLAEEGARIAQQAGLNAEPAAVEAAGPVWRTILDVADHHDAATIVMGSRGLDRIHASVLGSVSSAVRLHATRPALVVPRVLARAASIAGLGE